MNTCGAAQIEQRFLLNYAVEIAALTLFIVGTNRLHVLPVALQLVMPSAELLVYSFCLMSY